MQIRKTKMKLQKSNSITGVSLISYKDVSNAKIIQTELKILTDLYLPPLQKAF